MTLGYSISLCFILSMTLGYLPTLWFILSMTLKLITYTILYIIHDFRLLTYAMIYTIHGFGYSPTLWFLLQGFVRCFLNVWNHEFLLKLRHNSIKPKFHKSVLSTKLSLSYIRERKDSFQFGFKGPIGFCHSARKTKSLKLELYLKEGISNKLKESQGSINHQWTPAIF